LPRARAHARTRAHTHTHTHTHTHKRGVNLTGQLSRGNAHASDAVTFKPYNSKSI